MTERLARRLTGTPVRALTLALVAVAFQVVMVSANVWPAARIEPRDVPVVVAGPEPATSTFAQRLEGRSPGAFEVERLPNEQAARQALADRLAYGAYVVGPAGHHLLIATGASPAVAQTLADAGRQLSGRPVALPLDVAPSARHDPRGTGDAALVLALVLSGIGGAALLSFGVRSALWRTAGLLVFAAGSGLTSALIADSALSVLPGSFPAVAGAIALSTFAVSVSVAGLTAAIPRAGLGLGAAVMMLLANPWSGAASAAEMLPRPWGTVGQGLPAGAAATLLRSVTFFDGAGAGAPLAVLLIWISYGLVLLAAEQRLRRASSATVPKPAPRHAKPAHRLPATLFGTRYGPSR
ncbi:hypothetical protein ACRYCC_34335 [Actinomadura scrupuli]|uniref:hypothetical protein n=1 Tax=Actinomadura scrupuli TaxID=559629 RepID=UPI003D95B9FC